MHSLTLLSLALAPLAALAKTDLAGCTSTAVGASLTWYVPGTGELCDLLDCGGGRAPPMSTVPGCPAYVGTATYSPSYMAGWGPNGQSTTPATMTGTGTWTSKSEATPMVTMSSSSSMYGHVGPTGYGSSASHAANGTIAATAKPTAFKNGAVGKSGKGALALAGGAVAAVVVMVL
jgi:hypothetical protein